MGYLKTWKKTFKQKKKKGLNHLLELDFPPPPRPPLLHSKLFKYTIRHHIGKKQMFSNYELILQCDGVTYLNYKYTFLAFQLCFTRV